jgi:hypothetical protein
MTTIRVQSLPITISEQANSAASNEFPETIRRLERLSGTLPSPIRVLVLSSSNRSLPLDPHRFGVTEHTIHSEDRLPYANDEFDIVVAIDYLDSPLINGIDRAFAELFRISRHALFVVQRDPRKEILELEGFLKELHLKQFGQCHPRFLNRDREIQTQDLIDRFQEQEIPFGTFEETPLEQWLVNEFQISSDQNLHQSDIGYRKLFIGAKTFDATIAMEPDPEHPSPSLSMSERLGDWMGRILAERNQQQIQKQSELQRDLFIAQKQFLGLTERLQATNWSPIARRDSIGLSQLIPQCDLEPLDNGIPNAWRSVGNEPYFYLCGLIPAGWIRVSLRFRRLDRAKGDRQVALLFADYGNGVDETRYVERFVWGEILDDEIFIFLPKPVFAFRFQPLGSKGSFSLEEFQIEPISRLGALGQAIKRKWKLLRAYRCASRVMARGVAMILTGQWGKVWNKIFKGLPDSRLMQPEKDTSKQGYSSWSSRNRLSQVELARAQLEVQKLPQTPTLAILLAIDNPPEITIRQIIESIRRQVYPYWKLYLGVTGTTIPSTLHLLDRYVVSDARLHIFIGPKIGGLSPSGTIALKAIIEPLVVVVNSGFELTEVALLRLLQQHLAHPEADLILNRFPPSEDQDEIHLAECENFRLNTSGQQVHLFSRNDLLTGGDFPKIQGKSTSPGVEFVRRIQEKKQIHYYPDQISYPSLTLASVEYTSDEEVVSTPTFIPIPKTRSIFITGNMVGISGWDVVVYEVVRGLHALGFEVGLNAFNTHRPGLLPPHLMSLRRQRRPEDQELLICPPHLIEHHPREPGFIYFTMWESDRLKPNWVEDINGAKLVITPSDWGIRTFQESGVSVPIVKVPLGYDPVCFHPNGSWPDICTFGTAGALWGGGMRKNVRRIIELFQEAFPEEDDVRLRVKITPRCDLKEPDDPRIELLRNFLAPLDLAEWYRSLTAYVNGSFSEGFGLHLIEAMACGRPLISSTYSAVGEYFDHRVGYPVSYREVSTESDLYPGNWGIPDDESIKQAMREVYTNDRESRIRGNRAASRAQRFPWKETGRKLVQVLKPYLIFEKEELDSSN